LLSPCIFAQMSHLSTRITIHLTGVSLQDALSEIGRAGHFGISYDADYIRGDKPVNINATNIPVEKVLTELLGKKFNTKEIGNHVILMRNKNEVMNDVKAEEYAITGFIYSSETRQRLQNATVYEVEKRNSALTAQNGSYSVLIPGGKPVRGLCFAKAGFVDTVIFVKPSYNRKLDVMLKPVENNLSRIAPIHGALKIQSIDSMGFVNWIVPEVTRINSANLAIHTIRPLQVSIVPYIGTNWKVTGSITNRFSLNILAGYTGGLKGFEFGRSFEHHQEQHKRITIGWIGKHRRG
jgi:hypothetical protein